tara:strand:- start:23 stop:808 length:786 start_codon:yes stop_codon:yes gene_type:complete
MKNKKTILKDWNQNGYVNISFFTKEQMSVIKREGKRLLVERDSNWDKRGIEGSQPYRLPHTESDIFEGIMKDKRIHEIVKLFICNDNNISECDLQVTQTWMYFKPPGELGRDIHQNIFYTHCNWGSIVNINIAIDDSDEENGCVYYYPGSHKDKVTYPIPDELKSEERMKTNPSQWSNERGKPIFVPGTYVDGEWVDKYSKIYVPAKAGSVTFVHSHVLHGSEDNKSKDKWRMSFLVGFVRKGSYVHSGNEGLRLSKFIDV